MALAVAVSDPAGTPHDQFVVDRAEGVTIAPEAGFLLLRGELPARGLLLVATFQAP